jgi:hypothetical protein
MKIAVCLLVSLVSAADNQPRPGTPTDQGIRPRDIRELDAEREASRQLRLHAASDVSVTLPTDLPDLPIFASLTPPVMTVPTAGFSEHFLNDTVKEQHEAKRLRRN